MEWISRLADYDLANSVAGVMLGLMPFLVAAKTLALWWIHDRLRAQDAKLSFGIWTVRAFYRISWVSAFLTLMFARLAWAFHDEDKLGPWLVFMFPIEVSLALFVQAGYMMVRTIDDVPDEIDLICARREAMKES